MSDVSWTWCTLFLVGSLNLTIPAQTTSPANNISPAAARRPSAEQRALGLLDQLFAAAKEVKDDDLRIRLQAQFSTTLWDYDQPRARQQFLSAFQAIALAKLPKGEDRFPPPPYVGAGARFPLRNEILAMVSQRDPALAQEMIDSIVEDGPDPTPSLSRSPSSAGDDRANHYMLLAAALLSTDPARAIEAAKIGLAESTGNAHVFYGLVMFLQSLGQKDRAAADRLFTYTLSVVQHDLPHLAGSIRFLSIYVFPDYGGVMRLYFGPGADPRPSQEASPLVVESFLDFVFNAVVQQTSSQSPPSAPPWAASDYAAVKLLLPYFDKRMPEKAATLRSKLGEIVRSYPPGPDRDQLTDSANPSSAQDQASKADTARTLEEKNSLYRRAVMLYITSAEYDQAFSVAQKIGEPRLRSDMNGQILAARARTALQKQDFDAAYKYAKEIADPLERASSLCTIAEMIGGKDSSRAEELIGEARLLVDGLERNSLKLRAMLDLAQATEALDPEGRFQTMQSVVNEIDQIDFAPEWNMLRTATVKSNDGVIQWRMNYGLSMIPFDRIFAPLARADFDRALLLAQTISLKEASIFAQLAVCRAVLGKPRAPQSPGITKTTTAHQPSAAPKKEPK